MGRSARGHGGLRPVKALLGFSSVIDRINDRIGSWIQWLTLFMVIVGAVNALLRYATRFAGVTLSSNAFIDLQWYMFSLVFLLGAAWGLRNGAHVRVDVMYERLSRKARAWIDLCGTVLFLIPFSLLMLYVSWPPVRNSWAIRETSPDPGGLARYPIKTVILVCFALLLLQGVSEAIKTADVLRGTGMPPDSSGGEDSDRPPSEGPGAGEEE